LYKRVDTELHPVAESEDPPGYMYERSPAGCIVVDARCLQDPDYVERGVGRHTVNLLRHAPRQAGRPIVGLFDPSMPDIRVSLRELFDVVRPNAQFHDVRHAACFVSPSPMTHDPLFVARLLLDPRLLKTAVIYDFIPYELPHRYLTQSEQRHEYYTCLRWLSRYDLFLPISYASGDLLQTILGIANEHILVTGAALDGFFETPASPANRTHLLVIGGGDPRKNVECAIRAHALTQSLQTKQIPLIITGRYSPDQQIEFRGIAESLGAAPALVQTPGYISEQELVTLYRDALCVIAPSYAEGFDLPVVEAMAVGTPVLASDIPAHRELVQVADCRFDPDDHTRLSQLIGTLADAPEVREVIIGAQAAVWPRYRATAVAERFWRSIDLRVKGTTAAAVLQRRRPKLALLSPLPPDRSGVADYTVATCAELGQLTELHVFSQTNAPVEVPGAATVRPLSAIPNISSRFDGVVNVMGNNAALHHGIFEQLMRYGGACIAHDSRMLGFYRELGMERATYLASKELGRPVGAADIDRWLANEGSLETLHLGEIVAAADPTLVHSRVTARLIRERYGVSVSVLPFCIYRPWPNGQLTGRDIARQRLGLTDDEVTIVTFGSVHRTKAPVECLWALELLRGWGINASLHFVGEHAEHHTLERTVAELGLSGKVKLLDRYVSNSVYQDYLVAADLGIQLRRTYFGSLSGALLDCISAGLPTVTNVSLAKAMEAPDYVRSVPDELSPLLIAEALANLLDEGLAHTRPEAARKAFSEAHSFRIYARQLCQSLDLDILP
jgi:glycosyltransferase involved in cell wall biosynthesis